MTTGLDQTYHTCSSFYQWQLITLLNKPYFSLRYDSVYLTCSKKLTCSQLSLPHGTNKKLKCETKNKTMKMRSGPVPLWWGSPVGKRNLRWEGFVEKVGFELKVKEWRSDGWDIQHQRMAWPWNEGRGRSRSFKMAPFDRSYDFLLVGHYKYSCMLCHFQVFDVE